MESFTVLTAFVARIPRIQLVGRGGMPMIDKNGEPVYVPSLIIVKELLGSEDLIKYLGTYVFNICMRSSLFLLFVC